jgi:hypothetical protein
MVCVLQLGLLELSQSPVCICPPPLQIKPLRDYHRLAKPTRLAGMGQTLGQGPGSFLAICNKPIPMEWVPWVLTGFAGIHKVTTLQLQCNYNT